MVGAQVDATGGNGGSEADVGRRLDVGVAQDEGRAVGGERVAAREAAARGRPDRGGQVLVGPLALDGALDDAAHEQRGEPGGTERHDGTTPVRPAPARLDAGQEHPDEPVIGQVRDEGSGAVDARSPPERFEGGVDRLVNGAHAAWLTRRRRGRRP